MSFNLLQTTKELFNNEIITKASAYLGENLTSTQRAADAAIPAIGAALIDKTNSQAGIESLFRLVKEAHNENFLHNMLGMFDDNGNILSRGEAIVKNIFGDKTNNVANAVSQYAGIKTSAASSMLAMVAPVILGLLGKHVNEDNLNTAGFFALMGNQKNWLSGFLPAGWGNYFNNLGFSHYSTQHISAVPKPTASYTSKETVAEPESESPRWLLPVIILLLLAAALWYFLGMKGCNNDNSVTSADTAQTLAPVSVDTLAATTEMKGMVDTLTGDYLYNVGKLIDITLPNGTVLHVGEYSTEAKLVNFLMDKNAMVDTAKGNWFEFTNVRFKTGGAQISDSSVTQLKNFVMIANAFPQAKFKIGGYTDNTGDSVMNVGLSQKRADAVYAKVISLGAAKSSLTGAKGFGPQYPVGDNTTVEGRAMNRRVAINVKAK